MCDDVVVAEPELECVDDGLSVLLVVTVFDVDGLRDGLLAGE